MEIIPLMGLNGQWAIKKLTGDKKGYDDIDWGVVLSCPENVDKTMLQEINDIGNEIFESSNEKNCRYINPIQYHINIANLDNFVRDLPDMCRRYNNNDPASYLKTVRAMLPLLSTKSGLRHSYAQELSMFLTEEEYELVKSTLIKCRNWLLKIRKYDTKVEYLYRNLEHLKNNNQKINGKNYPEKIQFYHLKIDLVNNKNKNILTNLTPVPGSIHAGGGLAGNKLSDMIDMTLTEKILHDYILSKTKIHNIGIEKKDEKLSHEFILETSVSLDYLNKWLELLQKYYSMEKLLVNSSTDNTDQNIGLVKNCRKHIDLVLNNEKIRDNSPAVDVLLEGNDVKIVDVLRSSLKTRLGTNFIERLEKNSGSRREKISLMLQVNEAIKQANSREKREMADRLNPPDNCPDRDYSYGLMLVKPTGMPHDFNEIIQFLFDPKNKNSKFYSKLKNLVLNGFGEEEKKELNFMIDNTFVDCVVYNSFEPGQEPYFWEANYEKKNRLMFFYNTIMENFQGGKFVQIYILRSTLPQPFLDDLLSRLKGRETLVHCDETNAQSETVLFMGRGIRGVLHVKAIMLTEEKKDGIVNCLNEDDRRRSEEILEGLKLPMIFSRLPVELQTLFWDHLKPDEQQAMISNFIHTPDSFDTTYSAITSMMKKCLNEGEMQKIVNPEIKKKQSVVYDMVTALLRQRIFRHLSEKNNKIRIYPGNVRKTYQNINYLKKDIQ